MSEQSVEAARELYRLERQIAKVSAVLAELQKKKAELLAKIGG